MIKTKLFFILTIAFMLFTVIGTLSHEYGHILVAKSLGYKTTLHYGSMNSNLDKAYEKINADYKKEKELITSNIDSEEKKAYINSLKQLSSKSLLIRIGGPAQTVLTGCLGLFILYIRRQKRFNNGFQFVDWLAVFLSLFWLREVFNFSSGMASGLFFNGKYFGGDEAIISQMLDLPSGLISIILAIIGLLVSMYVVFKVIHNKTRLLFIFSGLVGGLSGFYIWFQILGPKLLP
jgi:hypothetical protein